MCQAFGLQRHFLFVCMHRPSKLPTTLSRLQPFALPSIADEASFNVEITIVSNEIRARIFIWNNAARMDVFSGGVGARGGAVHVILAGNKPLWTRGSPPSLQRTYCASASSRLLVVAHFTGVQGERRNFFPPGSTLGRVAIAGPLFGFLHVVEFCPAGCILL